MVNSLPRIFNGKESQEAVGLSYLDYGARMYDSRIGRWHSIDPLAEKYYNYSPYNYALNSPIGIVDVKGLYPESILNYKNGAYFLKQSAAYLISLFTGLDMWDIQKVRIEGNLEIGSSSVLPSDAHAMTIGFGDPFDHGAIMFTDKYFDDSQFGQDIRQWFSVSTHEFVHIGQYNEAGKLFIPTILAQYAMYGYKKAPWEDQAFGIQKMFDKFYEFIENKYGKNFLEKIFKNNNINEWNKMEDIRRLWNEYNNSFMDINNSFWDWDDWDSISEGTYFMQNGQLIKQ